MNIVQRVMRRAGIGGAKSMADLHPDLSTRVHMLTARGADVRTHGGYSYLNGVADYERNTWVRKAVTVIAHNFRALPIVVRRGTDAVPAHPLALLFSNVNGSTTSVQLWEQWATDMLLGGESGFELVRGGRGAYVEVWARQPHVIGVIPDAARIRYGGVAAYKIDDSFGAPYELPPDEFCFFKFYNPRFPLRGISVIGAVRSSVAIDVFAQSWSQQFFKKSARPDYAVIAPQGLTPDERAELELMLQSKFAGADNWYKPIVLEQGVTDVKPLDWRPKDMEWLNQRQLSREEIGAIFGVPDEIMGFGKDTYNNFQTALRVLWSLTIKPLAVFRDTSLTEYFRNVGALRADETIESDFSGVDELSEDAGAQWTRAQGQISAGALTINEWRKAQGLEPVAWGGVWWVSSALVPADVALELANNPPAPAPPPVAPAPAVEPPHAPDNPPMDMPADAQPPDNPPAGKAWGAVPAFGSPEHAELLKRFDARTRRFVGEWRAATVKIFERQRDAVIARLRSGASAAGVGVTKDATGVADNPFDKDAERKASIEAVRELLRGIVQYAGLEAARDVGGDAFSVDNPAVRAFLTNREQRFAEPVTETTWAALKESLNAGIASGENIVQLEQRVTDVMQWRIRSSAETIARTEVVGAFNGGTLEGWRQTGVVKRKTWIAELDARVRASHEQAHGQTVDFDAEFEVGDGKGIAPGQIGIAEEDINCRCTMIAEV